MHTNALRRLPHAGYRNSLFVVAAVFGLINLIAILQNKPTMKVAVLLHGGVAAAGLVMVLAYVT